MLPEIIDLVHFLFKGFFLVYPFLLSRYDWYYLLITYITVLSWSVFKGECIIYYYVKKLRDPTYIMGSNFDEDGYWTHVDPKYQMLLKLVLLILKMVGLVYVLLRNSYGTIPSSIIAVSFYLSISAYNKNKWIIANTQIVFGALLLHLIFKKLKIKL